MTCLALPPPLCVCTGDVFCGEPRLGGEEEEGGERTPGGRECRSGDRLGRSVGEVTEPGVSLLSSVRELRGLAIPVRGEGTKPEG